MTFRAMDASPTTPASQFLDRDSAESSLDDVPMTRRPRRLVPLSDKTDEKVPPAACTERAQELRARFSGLKPTDFHPHGVAIYVLSDICAPDGFESSWKICGCKHGRSVCTTEQRLLSEVAAVLMCCDIHNDAELRRAVALRRRLRFMSDKAPCVILLPHAMSPKDATLGDNEIKALSCAFASKVDGCVPGEPGGFRLAAEVRSAIKQQVFRTNFLNEEQRHLRQQAALEQKHGLAMEDAMHNFVWGDYRVRKNLSIPDVDPKIEVCKPGSVVGGLQLGKCIGKGSFGAVHMLHAPNDTASNGQVLKVLAKKPMTDVKGIKQIDNAIEVLRLLSSPSLCHPNVVRLFEVYQSRTELLLQLSDCGALDLYACLKTRETSPEQMRSLGATSVARIMHQCLDALCHLQLRAKVVHRDIKPENIIVSENNGVVDISISDFDLAYFVSDEEYCYGICGSFPFMAPEVVLEKRYKAFPADIWSMGLVLLELLCGIDALKKASCLKKCANRKDVNQARTSMMLDIVANLKPQGSVHGMIEKFLLRELESLKGHAIVLLGNMLKVQPRDRWTADRLYSQLSEGALVSASSAYPSSADAHCAVAAA